MGRASQVAGHASLDTNLHLLLLTSFTPSHYAAIPVEKKLSKMQLYQAGYIRLSTCFTLPAGHLLMTCSYALTDVDTGLWGLVNACCQVFRNSAQKDRQNTVTHQGSSVGSMTANHRGGNSATVTTLFHVGEEDLPGHTVLNDWGLLSHPPVIGHYWCRSLHFINWTKTVVKSTKTTL